MGKQQLGNASTVENKKDDSKVDKWIGLTDNIKQNLLSLKEDIKKNKKEESKSVLNLEEAKFDTDFDKAFSTFDETMEDHAEQAFDGYAQLHRDDLQKIIDDNVAASRKIKLDAFALDFQTFLFTQTDIHAEQLKKLATASFKIELNDLRDSVQKPATATETKTTEETKKETVESYIDPKNLNSTNIQSYTYYKGFDQDEDNEVDKGELKDADILNTYKNANKDKQEAILGILKAASEDEFEKSDIKSINRDDLTDILDDVIDNDFLGDVLDKDNKIDNKKIEKKFRDTFMEKGNKRYITKGRLNFNEINKIADIIEKGIGENGLLDPTNPVGEALQRLADIGDAAKNISYIAAHNDDVLISKIESKDVFLFLSDFDSDGKVDQSDIGSVMGGQFYTNFLQYADTEWEDIDEDGTKEKKIVDGKETSKLIKRLLEATKNESDNDNLKNAITDFITKKTTGDVTTITLDDFTTFMKGYEYTPVGATESIKVSATADVKIFIKSLAEQYNEGKDITRLFEDKETIQSDIIEATKVITEAKKTEVDQGNVFVKDIEKDYTAKIKEFIDANALQEEYDKDALDVKTNCVYNTVRIVNLITDLIYFDLGNTATTTIAGIFSGAEIGGVKYDFNNPDKTINEQKVKTALGAFIAERLSKSIGLAFDPEGNPVLGAAVQYTKLSDDLSNKFEAGLSGNANIGKLFSGDLKFNFSVRASKARQVNQDNVTKLNTKKPIPVNRIGIEGGIGTNFRRISPYFGIFFERDFDAGIEQKARKYDAMIKKVLGYPADIDIYTSKSDFDMGMKAKITELEKKDETIKQNNFFLNDMIEQIGKEMERAGVFDLLASTTTTDDQKKSILEYMYMTCIEAFHDNAIVEKGYEQLNGKIKITRFGLKAKLTDILKRAGAGAVAGSIIPGWGTVVGAATGTVVGLTKLSTRKTSYVEDAIGKGRNNYTNIEKGAGAEDNQDIIDTKNLETLRTFLDKELNPNEQLLTVAIENEKIVITAKDGVNPLNYLNVYYSGTALTDKIFSFENNKLTLGNASLRIARDIKRDKVETFLMIGEDLGGTMTKLSSATTTKGKDVNKLKEVEYYTDLPYDTIKTLVETDAELKTYKDIILGFFDTDGKLKSIDGVPPDLQGTAVSTGTLKFTQATDGKIAISSYDPKPADKFKIEYAIQTKAEEKKITTIDKEKYNEVAPVSTEKLFTPDTKFTTAFTASTEKISSLFDDVFEKTLYKDFMIPIVDKGVDNFIDQENYNTAFTELKEILKYNPTKYDSLTTLKTLIENATDDDKPFIVDKFKAIFSFVISLTDGSADGTNLTYLMNQHKEVYKTELFGPDGTTAYPLKKDYRTDILDNLKGETSLKRQTVENLIGFTAFYRLTGEGRGYSMTALGATNVLSNGDLSESMAKITDATDLSAAQERFTNNLDKNTTNKEIVLAKLNSQLESQKIVLTKDNLDQLFKGEYISIDNGKKKVKLDLQYYFYLLGECSNESIGAQINSIKIYEKLSGDYIETTVDGETGGVKSTKRDVTLETQTVNAEYDIRANKRDITIMGAKGKKAPGAEATAGESKESGNDNSGSQGGDSQDEGNGTYGPGGSEGP